MKLWKLRNLQNHTRPTHWRLLIVYCWLCPWQFLMKLNSWCISWWNKPRIGPEIMEVIKCLPCQLKTFFAEAENCEWQKNVLLILIDCIYLAELLHTEQLAQCQNKAMGWLFYLELQTSVLSSPHFFGNHFTGFKFFSWGWGTLSSF